MGEEVPREVVRVAQVHHCDLGTDLVERTVVLQLYNTARVVASVGLRFVVREKHLAHRTLAQLLLEHKFASWVLLDEVHVLYHLLKLASCQ